VVDALPFYYRQVFLGQALNESFWVGRERELSQARRAVQNHRAGESGVLLVVGRPGSGKTALCQRIAHKALDPKTVHWVQPPAGGSTELSVFREALRTATGGPEGEVGCDELLERLPEHATLVLDDVELWWERDEHGFAVMDELLRLIARHGHRTLFVLGMGHHAFRLLSTLRRLSDRAFRQRSGLDPRSNKHGRHSLRSFAAEPLPQARNVRPFPELNDF
jgi:Cdc6-like AAA superfamily ATPase